MLDVRYLCDSCNRCVFFVTSNRVMILLIVEMFLIFVMVEIL